MGRKARGGLALGPWGSEKREESKGEWFWVVLVVDESKGEKNKKEKRRHERWLVGIGGVVLFSIQRICYIMIV